jgi:hypothetical protein
MEDPIDGEQYTKFLEVTIPFLLEAVSLDIPARMWFQHEGAPPHFKGVICCTLITQKDELVQGVQCS